MNKILVVIKRPDAATVIEQIENDLGVLQSLVGGYIEAVTLAEDLILIVNEEGLINGMPFNMNVCGYPFYGTIVAVSSKGEEFASLKAANVPLVIRMLGGRK